MFINSDLQDRLLVQTIDNVATYLKRANYKHLPSRDTRYLMSLLVNLPKVDRHLMSLIRYRKLAVNSYMPNIKFPEEFKPTEAENKQLDDMKARWNKTRMYRLIDVVINGRLLGMSAANLNWRNYSDSLHHFATIEKIHPATDLDYDLDDTSKLKEVITDTKSQKFVRQDFNQETSLIVRDNPLSGFDDDFPGGLLRVNLLHIIIKYWDFFIWANTNEKYADPPRYATFEPHLEKYMPDILAQLAKMGTDSYGAFMKGVDVKVLDALKEGAIKSHVELEDSVNKGMSLSIAGQYSASDPDKGHSYATSKVGYQISEDVTYDDLVFIEREISTDYLMHDYKLNYGEPRNGYPLLVYKKVRIKDVEAHARIVTDYVNAGIPVSVEDVYDKPNFRRVKPGEEDVVEVTRLNPLMG
jgi:phage gp29-like protein